MKFYFALQSFRTMTRIEATCRKAGTFSASHSATIEPSDVRSTIQPFGRTSKIFKLGRSTISMSMVRNSASTLANMGHGRRRRPAASGGTEFGPSILRREQMPAGWTMPPIRSPSVLTRNWRFFRHDFLPSSRISVSGKFPPRLNHGRQKQSQIVSGGGFVAEHTEACGKAVPVVNRGPRSGPTWQAERCARQRPGHPPFLSSRHWRSISRDTVFFQGGAVRLAPGCSG